MSDRLQLSKRIQMLLEIFSENFDFHSKTFNLDENQTKVFNTLWKSIIEYLMWSPGTLVYIANEAKRKAAQRCIDLIWEVQDIDEMFEEMMGGGYAGLLVNIITDYVDRAKMLKPTLISVEPEDIEFTVYFEEAMKAWLYGLNHSSLIICCSIIEDMLKTKLCNIDPKLDLKIENQGRNVNNVKNKRLQTLINEAFKNNIISEEEQRLAHNIREMRNNAIHDLRQINEKQIYEAILDTKKIIEKIMTQPEC